MSGFSDHWLALREPADRAARGAHLIPELVQGLAIKQMAKPDRGVSVLDLGAGTGSNFRHLAPHLGHDQHWCLVDHDQALLSPAHDRLGQWASCQQARFESTAGAWTIRAPNFSATIETRTLDLATELTQLPWHRTDLVTGSALLDLVSQAWLDDLARLTRLYHCLALFALTYDGRMQWQPPLRHDEIITAAFNRHQQQDKGFGPALGPLATQASVDCFKTHDFHVQRAQTDWVLDSASMPLQRELTNGLVQAVNELESAPVLLTEHWLEQRLDQVCSVQATLTVGHSDLLALPSSPAG